MARSISEIKSEITTAWMNNSALQTKYGFDSSANWDDVFSAVSIENLIVYIVAVCTWTLEGIFDTHQTEVQNYVNELKPHSLRWYVNRAKAWQDGCSLVEGEDYYDNSSLTLARIEEAKVVKYAAGSEVDNSVAIKIATEVNGLRQPLTEAQCNRFRAYIEEIKDAGVPITIINNTGGMIKLAIKVIYNPALLSSSGALLADDSRPIDEAIEKYIQNLPFNGEYRDNVLLDELRALDCVDNAMLTSTTQESNNSGATWTNITNGKANPTAGYYSYASSRNNIVITYIAA